LRKQALTSSVDKRIGPCSHRDAPKRRFRTRKLAFGFSRQRCRELVERPVHVRGRPAERRQQAVNCSRIVNSTTPLARGTSSTTRSPTKSPSGILPRHTIHVGGSKVATVTWKHAARVQLHV
jgi:hypothetical protein